MIYDQPYNAIFMADKGKDKLVHLDKALLWAISGLLEKGDPDFLNWLNNFLRQMQRR